jgi:hypothetical protein
MSVLSDYRILPERERFALRRKLLRQWLENRSPHPAFPQRASATPKTTRG